MLPFEVSTPLGTLATYGLYPRRKQLRTIGSRIPAAISAHRFDLADLQHEEPALIGVGAADLPSDGRPFEGLIDKPDDGRALGPSRKDYTGRVRIERGSNSKGLAAHLDRVV
jgi:hypothetical protein